MEDWAKRIESEALARNLGPTGVAAVAGVKQASVSGWYGRGAPPAKTLSAHALIRICKDWGLNPFWVMDGVGNKLSQSTGIDDDILESAIVSAKEAFKSFGMGIDDRASVPVIAYAYSERRKFPRTMTRDEYVTFDNAVAAKLKGVIDERARAAGGAERRSRSNSAKRGEAAPIRSRGRRGAR